MTVKELKDAIAKLEDDIFVCAAYNKEGIAQLADVNDIADAVLISKIYPEPGSVFLLRYE